MKYLVISVLFSLSLGYAGYFLYMYDKRQSGEAKSASPLNQTNKKRAQGQEAKTAPALNQTPQLEKAKIPKRLTKEFWESASPELLAEELKSLSDVNEVRPDNGRSMLIMWALFGKYPEMADMLISAGADWALKDKISNNGLIERSKALHYAAARNDKAYEFTKKILEYDKDIDEEAYGSTPLMWAIYERQPMKVIKLLAEKGANIHYVTSRRYTVLISAAVYNQWSGESFINPEAVQFFLDRGADIMIKDLRGKTAYDYMKENEEFTKTELFKKLYAKYK